MWLFGIGRVFDKEIALLHMVQHLTDRLALRTLVASALGRRRGGVDQGHGGSDLSHGVVEELLDLGNLSVCGFYLRLW